MAAQQASDSPASALYDLIGSHRITAVIYVAARLGIADLLAEGPQSARALAPRTGAHEESLRRLLRALVALGLCKPAGMERFELTAVGRHLAGNAEQSMKAWALFEGEMLSRSWEGLLDTILTGKNAAELAGFDNSFELMAQKPERVRLFNEAMVAYTRQVTSELLAAYDFSRIARLLDVGGGYGELLCGILKAYPSMRGAIFDLPRCAEGARHRLADAGLADRAEFIAGSFFESVPSGNDTIILKSIIHDWNDERSIAILANCRRALPGEGRLLLVERVMPEIPEASAANRAVTLSDLNMLRGPGGCERTEAQYRELLGKGGFRMTRVLPAGRSSVIEAAVA